MTVPIPEPTNNGQGEEIKGHPAWEEILKDIPEEFHEQIKPTLKKWDDGVSDRFKEIHEQYDPYKKFIENEIPSEALEQGIILMQLMESDPNAVVAQAIEQFGLDYVEREMTEAINNGVTNTEPNGVPDISSDPRFKALEETVKQFQEQLEQQQEFVSTTKAQREYDEYMDNLHEEHGEFDDVIVTAFMSAGMDGEEAVKRYHDTINQAAAKIATGNNSAPTTPPVVMGGNGASGSGLPQQVTDFGKMGRNEIDKLVADMVMQANQEG